MSAPRIPRTRALIRILRSYSMSTPIEKSAEEATLECTVEQLRALHLLKTSKRFLLTGHVRPDGDCVGAQAALRPASETATRSGAKRDMIGRLRGNKVFDLDGPAS